MQTVFGIILGLLIIWFVASLFISTSNYLWKLLLVATLIVGGVFVWSICCKPQPPVPPPCVDCGPDSIPPPPCMDCGPDSIPSPRHDTLFIKRIRGKVINRRTMAPVAVADIVLQKDTFHSDSDGKFVISNVSLAQGATLEINKPGFRRWTKIIDSENIDSIPEIYLRPKLRIVFPPFQAELSKNEFDPVSPSLVSQFSKKMEQSYVRCQQDIEVFVYSGLPDVLKEIERVQRMGKLMDPSELIKIGRLSSANYLVSGSVEKNGPEIIVSTQFIEIETGTMKAFEECRNESEDVILQCVATSAEKMIASISVALITNYSDGEQVQSSPIFLEGINSCVPPSYKLWVAVQPDLVHVLYPQRSIPLPGDTWRMSPVHLGDGRTDQNQPYTLKIILADATANQEFVNYLAEGERTNRYPGMELPVGARIMDEVTLDYKGVFN